MDPQDVLVHGQMRSATRVFEFLATTDLEGLGGWQRCTYPWERHSPSSQEHLVRGGRQYSKSHPG